MQSPEDYTNFLKSLTVRELTILKVVVNGFTSKEIGETLNIGKKTVDKHRENYLKKAEVKGSHEIRAFMWEIRAYLN